MAGYFDHRLMILALALVSFWKANVAARKDCYPYIGCFYTSLKCHSKLPQRPDEVNTKFYLYTNENKFKPEIIDYKEDSSIIKSSFRGRRETKFIIHGFVSNYKLKKFQEMKNALLSINIVVASDGNVLLGIVAGAQLKLTSVKMEINEDVCILCNSNFNFHISNWGKFNVIMVDWRDGADSIFVRRFINYISSKLPSYRDARQNTRLVGRQIGELSRKLKQLRGARFDDMHLIGHSLGAQTAGFAGRYLSGQYGRITGLDPAGPGYEKFRDLEDCLLDRTDAKFVDIIHTSEFFGNQYASGHQDFYPNGGSLQVSCRFPRLNPTCNHGRAVDYFIESITSECPWRAYPCDKWSLFKDGGCKKCGEDGCPRMGYYADLSPATGTFMLETNKKKPFCKEDSGKPSPS